MVATLVAGSTMDWMPLVWAVLGVAFSGSCFGLYARFSAVTGSFDRDLVVLVTIGNRLGVVTTLRPHWMW